MDRRKMICSAVAIGALTSLVAMGGVLARQEAPAARARADSPSASLEPIATGAAVPAGPGTIDAQGTIEAPAMSLPFSSFASEEARQAFIDAVKLGVQTRAMRPADRPMDIAQIREATVRYMTPLLERALARYPAIIESRRIGGVATDIVVPRDGVSSHNRRRILINLHNGGFFVGGGISGKVEAVPIAGLGKLKVIAIDYRQGPEYKFPAASEDVVAVYRQLLKSYPAKNIGIYGCSAGGLLAAEAVAMIESRGLPLPGAIGIFCASAGGWAGGDSTYVTAGYSIVGLRPRSAHFMVSDADYFSAADMRDPLVAPIVAPLLLAKFPPTLILTGTRDVAMSAAIFTHGQLVKFGVDAELHVWDGLGHAFMLDAGLPESRDAYGIIVRFFERHLGGRRRNPAD